jgi:hypothetical protein
MGVVGRFERMRLVVTCAALAATAALAFGVGSASAKSCGAAVIQDWYVDGTIDGQYPAQCYREALARTPDQAKIYSDLPEQLDRGLRAAVAREARSNTLGTKKTITQPTPSRQPQAHKPNGPIQRVLGELGPDRADAIPIPLMILAGAAVLLIAAGAVSVIVRRLNGRRTPS